MGSEASPPPPKWASKPCIMGIDEAGRGPVLGPMVYGCLYCARSYQKTLSTLSFADSKTLKEEKREELFESLKTDESIGWAVDVIDPRELSAKMLKKNKINLNEISHDSAMGLIKKVLDLGVLLSEVYLDTVGDAEKYRVKLSERFPNIKFVVAKKADSLYPVVSGASIVAKVTRDRALRDWVLDETAESLHRNFGSGYPGDPQTKASLNDHKHSIFGFPALVRFSWGTCTSYSKELVEVLWSFSDIKSKNHPSKSFSYKYLPFCITLMMVQSFNSVSVLKLQINRFSPMIVSARKSDEAEEDDNRGTKKRQMKLTNVLQKEKVRTSNQVGKAVANSFKLVNLSYLATSKGRLMVSLPRTFTIESKNFTKLRYSDSHVMMSALYDTACCEHHFIAIKCML